MNIACHSCDTPMARQRADIWPRWPGDLGWIRYCGECIAVQDQIDLLCSSRIKWDLWIENGGDILSLMDEARQAGDENLYRRAKRAAERRNIW
jgi:hypothetical protein